MTTGKSVSPPWLPLVAAGVLAAATAGWAAMALRIGNPIVIWDEAAYLLWGVALDRADQLQQLAPNVPQYGNYLFLHLIHALDGAGLGLEPALKTVNVAAIALAAALAGRAAWGRVEGWRWLALFGVICAYPTGSYAAYVMPEAVYAGAFALIWAGSGRLAERSLMLGWCAFAAADAALSLIKPHGAFLMIAWIAATVAWALIDRRLSWVAAAKLCAASSAVYVGSFWLLHALLAPPVAGDSLIGASYRAGIAEAAPTWPRLLLAARSFGDYAGALLLLYAPSVVLLVQAILARSKGNASAPDLHVFRSTFLLLAMLVVVTACCLLLSDGADRISLRYVGFLLPWLLVQAAVSGPEADRPLVRRTAAAVWLVAGLYFAARLPWLRPLPVDAPELFFTYASGEFGAFGLGRAAYLAVPALVALGAVLLAFSRIPWLYLQLGFLALTIPLSVANTGQLQALFWRAQAPKLKIAEKALASCQPDQIRAVVTKATGPPVYTVLYGLRRPTRLEVYDTPAEFAAAIAAAPEGSCLLTSLPLAGKHPLAADPGAWLYRLGR